MLKKSLYLLIIELLLIISPGGLIFGNTECLLLIIFWYLSLTIINVNIFIGYSDIAAIITDFK